MAFALIVMSPVGYVAARAFRRLRVRRQCRAVLPEGALEVGHMPTALARIATETRDLRRSLDQPLLAAEDYLATLPVLDIAVNLSRIFGSKRSWGLRMRASYADTVEAAHSAVSRWCETVEGLEEREAQILQDLGLSTSRVRSVLMGGSGLTLAGHSQGLALASHGNVREVEQMKQQVHTILVELATFESTLVEHGRDPYR
jgi:1-acyl-sn-glycerol-3-phosphate acyltransferase